MSDRAPSPSRAPTISQVRYNAESDPAYCPYCLRCKGLVRMRKVEPFFWRCVCGAEHDERAAASPPSPALQRAIADAAYLLRQRVSDEAADELERTFAAATQVAPEPDEVLDGLSVLQDALGDEGREDRAAIVQRAEATILALRSSASALAAAEQDRARWQFFRKFLSCENDERGQYLYLSDDETCSVFLEGYGHTVEELVDEAIRRAPGHPTEGDNG